MKTGSSQWPETTTIALGRSGRVSARPRSQASVFFQVYLGPPISDQSMKKHGPPPWGMNKVGMVAVLVFSPSRAMINSRA